MAKHETGTTLGNYPELYPYVLDHIGETSVQIHLRDEIVKHERSRMMGAPDEAQFLGWLGAVLDVKKVIEVGVFRGSTTLALALNLPHDAKIIGLDISEEFATLGKAAWKEAGVEHKIDFRVGSAVDSMDAMIAAGEAGSYDLVFIDADKSSYDAYYEKSLILLRPGGIIAVDNVLWGGSVIQPPAADDADTAAIITLNEKIKHDSRVKSVLLPIADGCYLARKL
eukprot:scaffold3553_cov180-Ochromonas_danica.AAC.9